MLTILYRDAQLIAIDKPAGLIVHRSVLDWHETRFALQLLRDQIGQRVYAVHRLDKGTSGVLLFALDKDSARQLSHAFETQQIDKTYLAVVRGWPADSGEIDHPLSRRYDDVERVTEAARGEAQSAHTRYRTLARTEVPVCVEGHPHSRYALVCLAPSTGRRHQLRRHLKHIAHPIIGDSTFGRGKHNRYFAAAYGADRMLLHCARLTLPHPQTGATLTISAPPGGRFAKVLAAFGWQGTSDAALLQSAP